MNPGSFLRIAKNFARGGSAFHKNFARIVCLRCGRRILAPPPPNTTSKGSAIESQVVGLSVLEKVPDHNDHADHDDRGYVEIVLSIPSYVTPRSYSNSDVKHQVHAIKTSSNQLPMIMGWCVRTTKSATTCAEDAARVGSAAECAGDCASLQRDGFRLKVIRGSGRKRPPRWTSKHHWLVIATVARRWSIWICV